MLTYLSILCFNLRLIFICVRCSSFIYVMCIKDFLKRFDADNL